MIHKPFFFNSLILLSFVLLIGITSSPVFADTVHYGQGFKATIYDDKITVESNYGASYLFDQQACDFKIFERGLINAESQLRHHLKHTVKEAVNGTNTFSDIPVNDQACSFTYSITNSSLQIVATKNNANIVQNTGGIFKTIYDITPLEVEWTYDYTNLDLGKNNHKYGFVFQCDGECGQVSFNSQDLAVQDQLTREQLQNNTIKIGKSIFDPKNDVHDQLWSIKRPEAGKLVVDFTNSHDILPYGKHLVVDPFIVIDPDFSDAYTTNTGWTQTGDGSVTVDSGVADKAAAITAPKNGDNRVRKALGFTASDSVWVFRTEFSRATSSGAGLPVVIAAGTGDPNNTTQDAIILYDSTTSLRIAYKDGAGAITAPAGQIAISDSTQYYVEMVRDSTIQVTLNVYSDSGYSTHIAGSPYSGAVTATVTGLTTLHHSVQNSASADTYNFNIDNFDFWDGTTDSVAEVHIQSVKFRLFENDGTTAVTSATITVTNSTDTLTDTTNSTGVTGAFSLQEEYTSYNMTGKTGTTNYVVFKRHSFVPSANQTETRSTQIFDVTGCVATISNIMINQTDRTNSTFPLAPSCSSNVLTFNTYFQRLGMGNAASNLTTIIRMEVPSTSAYATAQTVYINGTAVSMTYSSGILTSGNIQVGNAAQSVILKVRITFNVTPNAVTNLSSPDQTVSTIELLWSQPNIHNMTLQGYQINYTTPHGTPLTKLVNNTNSSSVNYVVSGLLFATQYSFEVAPWTTGGTNTTGNILNSTTDGDTFTVGAIVVNQTNPDIVDIRFERIDINDTALFLNVTYSSTFNLACDFTYKFARINQTYTNLDTITISSGIVESSFLFTSVDNEIIDVLCWDQDSAHVASASVGAGAGNYTHAGSYIITQTQFPLLDQINNFRNGVYGTEGKFGVLDLVTLGIIIISMIGFNRVNETVGIVFNIILLGALSYFEIIVLPTLIFGALAVVVVFTIASTRKD